MSRTTNASARTVLLIVVALLLTVPGSGALGIRVHDEQESDRRSKVERQRPDPVVPFADPFPDPVRR